MPVFDKNYGLTPSQKSKFFHYVKISFLSSKSLVSEQNIIKLYINLAMKLVGISP